MIKVAYSDFQNGEFTVSQGTHEVTINTDSEPQRVWISLEDTGVSALAVCMGNTDKVGATIIPEGFVAHVDIQSTERTVKWYAEPSGKKKKKEKAK
jgi:hypothetical protein